jgi:cell wall-associated NlpC family hydrolase
VRGRGLTTAALAAFACAGCGTQTATPSGSAVAAADSAAVPSSTATAPAYHAHPQAIEPVAGAAGAAPGATAGAAPASASVSVTPTGAGASLAQPLTVADIRHELARSGMGASTNQATLTSDGLAVAPIDAPAAVQAVIAAGNEIARLPYRWGGGHMTYEDTAYDCSGSISYVFAAAHLLDRTVVSGQLANWGAAGPGKWITVFANAGHTFMYVAGLRFDTVALAETGTRWSNRSADESNLSSFSVRHPRGL